MDQAGLAEHSNTPKENRVKEIHASQAYRLLEPGPTVLLITSDAGKPNVMTMGFHMMVQHEPPLIGCVVGPWDFSHHILQETGECVIAVPGVDLAETVVDIGNCSGEDVDKFERFGLTTKPSKNVSPPLLRDCIANIECRVVDTKLSKTFNLFILQAITVWINESIQDQRTLHHRGQGIFSVDGEALDLSNRMVKWRHLP